MKQKLYRLQSRAGLSSAVAAAGAVSEDSELRYEQTFCRTSLGARDRTLSRLGSRRLHLTRRRPVMFKTYILSYRWRFRQFRQAHDIPVIAALSLVIAAILAHVTGLVP